MHGRFRGLLPLQQCGLDGLPAAQPNRRRERQRHLGLDRPADRQRIRHHGPHERDLVRGHQRPGEPCVPRQSGPARNHFQVDLAGYQGPCRPRFRRQRGEQQRDAGLRPDAVAQRRVAAGHVHRDCLVQRLSPRAQYRHQRRQRLRLWCGHQQLFGRPPHGGYQHADRPGFGGLFQRRRVYPRRPMRELSRPRPRPPRRRDLLQLEHRHAHRRGRDEQGRPQSIVKDGLCRGQLYPPRLADRGPRPFSDGRRGGRNVVRAQHADLYLGRVEPRRPVAYRNVYGLHAGDRPTTNTSRAITPISRTTAPGCAFSTSATSPTAT